MNSSFYQKLIAISQRNESPIQYQFHPVPTPSLSMTNHNHPVSISEREFQVISATVSKYQFKYGFEVATAFGVSGLAAALPMQQHQGKLITMDAYIEEQQSNCAWYRDHGPETYQDSDGWKSVQFLRQIFGLEDVLIPVVGWSPTDTIKRIQEYIGTDTKLNYAFIDAAHWDEAFYQDVQTIIPLMDFQNPWIIFIHDAHAFSPETISKLNDVLSSELRLVKSCAPPNGYNLSYWSSIEAIEPD